MFIGTSLGQCLGSILKGEVQESQVALIIARTKTTNIEQYINLVKGYYNFGNPYASMPERYDLSNFDIDTDESELKYSLETWDNFLGEAMENPAKSVEFNDFSAEPTFSTSKSIC